MESGQCPKKKVINGRTRDKLGRLKKHICWPDQSKTVRIDKQLIYVFVYLVLGR